MNSFLYGMELFQIRMNTFQIGMYSLYVRYSHTDVIRVNNVLDCVAKYKNMNLWWQVKCDDSLQSFKQCNTSIKCCRDENFIFRFRLNLNT